eukprot:11336685-Prorocentrum_lima.AAC.1
MKLAQELFMIVAHVVSQDCLSDCLTKHSTPDIWIDAINGGILPNVDEHPPLREPMKDRHTAYYTVMA